MKLYFCRREEISKFLKNRKKFIFNFLNLHDLYFFQKNVLFKKVLTQNFSRNFIDSFIISLFLSIKKLKKIGRLRGPTFTLEFLEKNTNKKYFFIGLEEKDLNFLVKKFPKLKRKNLFCYNPPYIKGIIFKKNEINKISKLINKSESDYVLVGIGSPKQNILSYQLFNKTRATYFFNVGAAFDFILGEKREAPLIIQKIGLEWFYRLITDFKYSRKKVWRSFIGLIYLLTK
ncbi:MAG: WecB/TagA/CpsF family glycosyltransferase, partial [Candidatus Nanoarchaeia archaeon]